MDRDLYDWRVNFDCDENPKSLTIDEVEVQYSFLPSCGKRRASKISGIPGTGKGSDVNKK
jgi:hypothetical protein